MSIIDKKRDRKETINSNLYHIERQIQFLKEQKESYEKKLENLEKYDIFTINELKEILEYLVSSFEGENYTLEAININKKSFSYHVENMISEYTFLYLIKENNKDIAKEEIRKKHDIKVVNGENYIENMNSLSKSDLSDNYINLAVYNRYGSNKIRFNESKETDVISINIEDERFNYINDFINELLNKKLDKSSFKLSKDEIKSLTDDFINKYKDEKKLVKDIK